MKKAVAALFSAVFLITGCLSGCSADRAVLAVGGAEVGSEIYRYFLDLAVQEMSAGMEAEGATEPDTVSAATEDPVTPVTETPTVEPAASVESTTEMQPPAGKISTQALYDRAEELCAEYVAVNSLFQAYNCSLTAAEKSEVSVTTNDLWRLYGRYYESIGVSKQTFYKIQLSTAYRDAILDALYGEGGIAPVSEDQLRQYYEAHYIVFRAISGYYTSVDEDGNSVPMDEAERAATDSAFNNMAERINGGTDINTAYNDYLESIGDTQADETVTVRIAGADSQGYPEGFFDTVHALEQDTATVVRLGDYIYVIVRLDPYTEDSSYYQANKADVLRGLKAADFDALVRDHAQSYDITVKDSAQQSCLRKIEQKHSQLTFI